MSLKIGKSNIGVIVKNDSSKQETKSPNILHTFAEAYVAWCNNEKFPIAFCGDSTFAGHGTSGDGYTFCDKLQEMLRTECGGNATIYRLAVSGTTLDYGIRNFDTWFQGDYSDTKMIGIGWGINDRLNYSTYKQYYDEVYEKIDTLIQKAFSYNMQPFLITSQMTLECGVSTQYENEYPLRDSNSVLVCADNAKKDLAKKYGIQLIDFNKYTELYLHNSLFDIETIVPDRLHFGNMGNLYQAGFFFSQMVPRTILVEEKNKCIVSYANQHLRNAVPEDKLSYGTDFKVYANYQKAEADDKKIMDAYIFIKDKPASIYGYKNENNSLTYAIIDGISYDLDVENDYLDTLDLGLHHLEVYTGQSNLVDFNGFVINYSEDTENYRYKTYDTRSISGNSYAFQNMSESLIPAPLMFNFNSANKTTALSGKTIKCITIPSFSTAGTITIGKVNLNEYGKGTLTLTESKNFTLTKTDTQDFELNMKLGEHETLAIGAVGNTAKPYCVSPNSNNAATLDSSTFFKQGKLNTLGYKCCITYADKVQN